MGIKFLNPYHFISLQQNKDMQKEENGTETYYTGALSYTVTTKTPLFIPGQIVKTENEHSYKRFFTYENTNDDNSLKTQYRPSIPGSEIRGVIRSIYETLTNSCLSMIDEEESITRRISDVFDSGLIRRTCRNGKIRYVLLMAKKAQISYDIIDQLGLKDGSVCKGKLTSNGRRFKIQDNEKQTGYLLKGEKIENNRKSHYTIMYLQSPNVASIALTEEDIKNLKHVISVYDDERLNKQINQQRQHWYAGYQEELDKFLSGTLTNNIGEEPLFPVYYSTVESNGSRKLYLSPACITKEIYNTKIGDIIEGYHPCSKKTELCPACHLFGMVGESNEDSVAGKLRFTDLNTINGSDSKEYYYHGNCCDENGMVTLRELSMPKPSSAEFYLQKPQNAEGELLNWNYDYYVYQDNQSSSFMISGYEYSPHIMGRKYYWHNLSPQFSIDRTGDIEDLKTKRNQTVQLVDQDKTFQGEIYFDHISETELRRLIWICNISSLWPNHGYKIGGGKPLGLGSVEMHVTGVYQRILSMQEGKIQYCGRKILDIENLFKKMEQKQYYEEGCHFSKAIQPQFELLTKFLNGKDMPEDSRISISYPIAFLSPGEERNNQQAEGYQWFANNRVNASNGNRGTFLKRIDMKFDQYLEKLEDIPKALLDSTIKSKPAEVWHKDEESAKNINTPSLSSIDIMDKEKIYSAVVTGGELSRKKYIVNFKLKDDGPEGSIAVKKAQSGNFTKGTEIKVRCDRMLQNAVYSFKLV